MNSAIPTIVSIFVAVIVLGCFAGIAALAVAAVLAIFGHKDLPEDDDPSDGDFPIPPEPTNPTDSIEHEEDLMLV